ncbi:hypothetical protein C8R44DRAFT_723802 [Mycena epipterygia]|nr:hypothetical protein C8R44DRAFT_723802 [Mycena epipterygia]
MPDLRKGKTASEEYKVEKIVGKKYDKRRKTHMWLVRWRGYGAQFDTWQTSKDLKNAPEMMLLPYVSYQSPRPFRSDDKGRDDLSVWPFRHKVTTWISFNGQLEDIPYEAIDFRDSYQLSDLTSADGRLMEMDPEVSPMYYNPNVPYRAYAPAAALGEGSIDEIAWLFDPSTPKLDTTNLDRVNSQGSHRNYVMDSYWVLDLVRIADRVHQVCEIIGKSSSWRRKRKRTKLLLLATGLVLEHLGFLSWLMTVDENWFKSLNEDMYTFVIGLRLAQHPKRGCLFNLCWDWRSEKEEHLFVFSEVFLKEYFNISDTRGKIPVPVEELPSYQTWTPWLVRYDYFQQDTLLGMQRDWKRLCYYPDCLYHLVLGEGWKARDLTDRREIRFCAAQFNAMAVNHKGKSHITFFNHYPLRNTAVSVPPPSSFPVAWFGHVDESLESEEKCFYGLDLILKREQWKAKFAPKNGQVYMRGTSEAAGYHQGHLSYECQALRDRLTSPTTGYGESGSTRHQALGATPRLGHDDLWSRSYQQVGSARRRTSRSMSPRRRQMREQTLQSRHGNSTPPYSRGRSLSPDSDDSAQSEGLFEDEFHSLSLPSTGLSDNTENNFFENMLEANRDTPEVPEAPVMGVQNMPGSPGPDDLDPFSPNATDPRQNYKFLPETKTDFLAAHMDWVPMVTEDNPHLDAFTDVVWDPLTIERGILVFDDPCMQVQMRACTLEPGFRKPELTWQGGGVSTRNTYLLQAGGLLSRPHARAFLMKGGIANRVSLWVNPDLVYKLAEGPSMRVTEYFRGFVLRARVDSEIGIADEVSLTRDQVSDKEMRVLLGYINNGGPEVNTSLFPPQWLLERESPGHFHGIMTKATQTFFNILVKEVTGEGVTWRTRSGWVKYLRRAGRLHYAPISRRELPY